MTSGDWLLKHVWWASGQYASYWNAFLFLMSFTRRKTTFELTISEIFETLMTLLMKNLISDHSHSTSKVCMNSFARKCTAVKFVNSDRYIHIHNLWCYQVRLVQHEDNPSHLGR